MLRGSGISYGYWRIMRSFGGGEQSALERPTEENSKSCCNHELLENDLGVWPPCSPGTVTTADARNDTLNNSDSGHGDREGQSIVEGWGWALKTCPIQYADLQR